MTAPAITWQRGPDGLLRAVTVTDPPPRWYTAAEVAAMLRIHEATVYRLIAAKRLRAVRVRRAVRIPATAVDGYLSGGAA